ncbi:MAG: AMP-binding protein [Candidatus Aminicenantales bacterium]
MLLNEFLEQSEGRFPDKTALVCGRVRSSFREIEEAANRLANGLVDLGLRRGDRVAVFAQPSLEAVVSIFAALKAGGVFVVINPQVKLKKLRYILKDCGAGIMVSDSAGSKTAGPALKGDGCSVQAVISTDGQRSYGKDLRTAVRIAAYPEIMKTYPAVRPAPRCIDVDLAGLVYTSGSTGFPKGVMLTHLNMVTAARSIIQYLGNSPDDVILNVLPLSFDYGLYQVLMAFRFGGTVIQERSFSYPYRAMEILAREKVTGFPVVPAMAALMLRMRNLERFDFRSLRYITNTAQALPPPHIEGLRKIFPRARIFSMYGLTECKRVSYLPPEEIDRRPASVGKAMPNTEAYIVDAQGNRVEEADRTGELVVRGSHVMRGYWNLPDDTARVLKPGPLPGERVLYTGDLFKMDSEGFLYFVGRKDEMIKVSGFLVSPKEVENALTEISAVREAAVVGVEDPITGQAVKAFVVLKGASRLKPDDIRRLSARSLESFMVPKHVEFRKDLPKNAHGKVSKRDLLPESIG